MKTLCWCIHVTRHRNQEQYWAVSDLEEVCDGGDVTGTGTFPGIWHVFANLRGKEVVVKKLKLAGEQKSGRKKEREDVVK